MKLIHYLDGPRDGEIERETAPLNPHDYTVGETVGIHGSPSGHYVVSERSVEEREGGGSLTRYTFQWVPNL